MRIARLEQYEQWRPVTPLRFDQIIGEELWQQHWENWRRILSEMRTSQELAREIRQIIRQKKENA